MPARYVTMTMSENQARLVRTCLTAFVELCKNQRGYSAQEVHDAAMVMAKIDRELSFEPVQRKD